MMELVGEVINGLVVVAGIYLAFWFDRKKIVGSQIWIARKDAYSVILSKLDRAAYYAEKINEGYNSGEMHPEQFHSTSECTRYNEELSRHMSECMESVRNNRVILSDKFASRFHDLRRKIIQLKYGVNLPPSEAIVRTASFSEGHEALLNVARQELNKL